MSRKADIDIDFVSQTNVRSLLDALATGYWEPIKDGGIEFMSGDSDWHDALADSLDAVLTEMELSINDGHAAAIALWAPEGLGMSMLLHPSQRAVSFMFDRYRRTITDASDITDLGWYFERIVPHLVSLGIDSVAASDGYE